LKKRELRACGRHQEERNKLEGERRDGRFYKTHLKFSPYFSNRYTFYAP
jgi:hypothetical protein